jgi:xanthine dehydrogenase YagS FAD-binding subunit
MNYFEYKQPSGLEEAGKWLVQSDKVTLPLSGGTDLLGLVKHNILKPAALVNLKAIKGLNEIKYKKGKGLSIGAQVKISEVSQNEHVREIFPVLSEAAFEIASPQLRNVGTVGGNLCQRPRCWYFRGEFDCLRKGGDTCFAIGGENKFHCIIGGGPCYIVHPSDLAVALLAVDAQVSIYSDGKTRTIPISDFFILPEDDVTKENILKPGEILTEIYIPDIEPESISHYTKFKERTSWDFAIVSVASRIRVKGKRIESGKLAFGGIAPKPWTDDKTNQELKGLKLDSASISQFVSGILTDAETMEKNEYKVPLLRNLVQTELEKLKS